MSMAHKSGNSGSVLGGGFEYKIPVKSWNVGIKSGGKDGAFALDDFLPFDPGVGGGYLILEADTGSTVLSSGAGFGEVVLTTDGTDNDEVGLGAVKGGVGCLKLVADKQCAAAIRFKVDQVASAKSLFVGWMTDSQAVAANNIVDDTGVLMAVDGVGLQLLATAADLRLVHGASLAAPTIHTAVAKTLVADTYVNFSLVFDGTDARFYIDGIQVGDKVARTTLVPADEPLRPVILAKCTDSNAVVVTVDSIAGASER